MELKHILRIGSQAAAGLAAAHKTGLIHRDVKPANILLENGVERVKITDFGLARAADDLEITQTGMIAGTPQYMSPEQAKGEPIDTRSDLFSLGSVLYTMCTGRPAFRADNTVAVLRHVCDDAPRPIHEVNAEIPAWLEAIVNKLLAKDPANRFQTAGEVAELLSQHLAHVQNPAHAPFPATIAAAPSANVAGRSANWRSDEFRKRIGWLAVALLMMFITIGITLFVTSKWIDARRIRLALAPPVDNALIQGTWAAVSGEVNGGQALPSDQLIHMQMIYKGDRVEVRVPKGQNGGEGTFQLDTAASPKRLKITRPEGPNRFAVMDGIYELSGDRLRICMGEPEEKVTEFKSRAGTHILLAEFVRLVAAPGTIVLPSLPDPAATSGQAPKSIYETLIPGLTTLGPAQTRVVDLATWGKFIDPRGECKLQRQSSRVTITVPGTRPFNLMMPEWNLDAPRLLEEVEGDFVVQVAVPPYERPTAGTSSRGTGKASYRGAALLVWINEQNLLRWERSAWGEYDDGAPFFHGEWCAAGVRTDMPEAPFGEPNAVAYLQIERRGSTLVLRSSFDGQSWRDHYTVTDLKLPARVSVGLVAQNSTNTIFSSVFEHLAIAQKATAYPAGSSADILTSADWEWSEPENLGPLINTDKADGGATLSGDGLMLVFHSNREDGQGGNDLWFSTRPSLAGAWAKPQNLGPNVNTAYHENDASLSADGLILAYSSHRPGGLGKGDLWIATRPDARQPWSPAVNLPAAVNSDAWDAGPALSADGLTLLFHSDREGSVGGADLWQCTRDSVNKPWSAARNLGAPINSPAYEGCPALASDGLALLFDSERAGGRPFGPLWICRRSRPEEAWSQPEQLLPAKLNGAWSPCLSADHTTLLFDSQRPGGQGDFDLWLSRRVRKQPPSAAAAIAGSPRNAAIWQPPENPEPEIIFSEAQADARAKRYEAALAKHIWFHQNAEKYGQSLNVTRLYSALVAWKKLGDAYPPALVKLKEARDQAAANVRAGKQVLDSFQELTAINRILGEEAITRDAFIALNPKTRKDVNWLFRIARPALIRLKEYKLCLEFIDPAEWFADAAANFHKSERSKDFAGKKQLAETTFVNRVATLVALLAVTDRKDEAETFASQARKEWDNAAFGAALDAALQGTVPDQYPNLEFIFIPSILSAGAASPPGPKPAAAQPVPAAIQALRDLVAAKERSLTSAQSLFKAAEVTRLQVLGAEVELVEARIRLAEAEQQQPAMIELLKNLVALRQEARRLTEETVKAGGVPQDELNQADARLADAQARLAKVEIQSPPEK